MPEPQASATALEGDVPLWGDDAFVVAPASGRVDIDIALTRPGAAVYKGAVVGVVRRQREAEVIVSRFSGRVERALVEPGTKVRPSQPVLWIRKTDSN